MTESLNTSHGGRLPRKEALPQALLILLTLAIAVDCLKAQTSNWPQWRGAGGSGISTEKNLPVEWNETKNIRWKTAIPGRGHSSPIVWGRRIFLTTSIEGPIVPGAEAVRHIHKGQEYRHPDSVGADHSYVLKLLSLDTETGKLLWEKQFMKELFTTIAIAKTPMLQPRL